MTNPANPRRQVALVIASIDSRATIMASLASFQSEARDRAELVLVDASRDGTAELVDSNFPDVRLIRRPAGVLVPELWRDGLNATTAPFVAFSTASMLPTEGWLDALLSKSRSTDAAAVGGSIEPSPTLRGIDRAIYLLRYVHYLRPLPASMDPEPPGDNALYRRDRLAGLESLMSQGFWEAEIHRALRARGERTVISESAMVTFLGGARLIPALRQRLQHARNFGSTRSSSMTTLERLARTACAPLVPAVLSRRIARALRVRGQSIRPWASALPGLLVLITAWSAGEVMGTWWRPIPENRVARDHFQEVPMKRAGG